MSRHLPEFGLRLAGSEADRRAAQALRFRVFVEELGATGPGVDREVGLETDPWDPFCDHLLVTDVLRGGEVAATCRLLDAEGARRAGGFACEAEFDLRALRGSGRRLLEVGRVCVAPAHRNGAALHRLWQGIAQVAAARGAEVLFGAASFAGTDLAALAQPLSALHHDHLAPEPLRPVSRDGPWSPLPPEAVDRRAAMLALPPLVKAYLRLGGRVGLGPCVDRAFGCTDLCMVLDTGALSPAARAFVLP